MYVELEHKVEDQSFCGRQGSLAAPIFWKLGRYLEILSDFKQFLISDGREYLLVS
jgi:hypothetical protein